MHAWETGKSVGGCLLNSLSQHGESVQKVKNRKKKKKKKTDQKRLKNIISKIDFDIVINLTRIKDA